MTPQAKRIINCMLLIAAIMLAVLLSGAVCDVHAQEADTILQVKVPVSESPEDSVFIVWEVQDFIPDTGQALMLQKFDYYRLGENVWTTAIWYADDEGYVTPTVMVTQFKIDWKAEAEAQGVTWRDVLYIVWLYFKN